MVAPSGHLAYVAEGDRAVIMKASLDVEDHPVIGAFLEFLAHDMVARPDRLAGLMPELIEFARTLTHGIEADFDASINGGVAI
jgi:hypothetical protein